MNYFIYPLGESRYINRFITTGTFSKPQAFKKTVLSGNINEWLEKDFSIYENPCRKEFIERRKAQLPEYPAIENPVLLDEIEVFGEKRKLHLYYPFGNQGVDFSEFYFNPTYLRCYSFVNVFSEHTCNSRLRLETCGGLTLWINGDMITDFIPYTRNMVKKQEVEVCWKQGFNRVAVCLDDLAERDTDFYFRICELGEEKLKLCIPAGSYAGIDEMEQVENMLSDLSFEKETYVSEPVELSLVNPLEHDLTVQVTYKPVADKIWNAESLSVTKSYIMEPGAAKLTLFSADDVIPGFYFMRVEAGVDGVKAGRTIATQIFHRRLLEAKNLDLDQRKKEALAYLRDTEVANVYKAAAMLALDCNREYAERIIMEELQGIRMRKDCSDFHLIVILQIMKQFGGMLTETVKAAVRDVILGFRYWIDEPGDDVMWFFSENHALLFHVCQYAAGCMYPDDLFENSQRTGRQQKERGQVLLEEWFDGYFNEYITEWNSNAYIPVDVLGLCGLYNLAEENSDFKKYASEALDQIFRDLALNEHKGMIMTTFGRSYEKESKGNYAAGTTSLLYIAYNRGALNRAALAYISLILGDYAPPEKYGRYMGLKGNEALVYEKTQGYRQHVNLYMYKNARVQISTAVFYRPFANGYQEHIMQATLDATAQMYVNHPGEVQPYGNGRPNYWAGNGSLPLAVQHENTGVMIYHIPEDHPVSYTHAYIPLMEFDSYIGTGNTVAAEKDGGYIGVKAKGGLTMQTTGPCKYREFISEGRDNIWIVRVGTKEEYGSLAEFYKSLDEVGILEREDGTVEIESGGSLMTISKERFLVDGKPQYRYPLDPKGLATWKNEEEVQNED